MPIKPYFSPLLHQQKKYPASSIWKERETAMPQMPSPQITGPQPSNQYQAGWYPTTATTGITTGTTAGEQWWVRPTTPMPKYEIPETEIRKLAREHLSTAMRPMRRGLQEALAQAQSAPTGPLKGYLMRQALQGFSGGIGAAVQRAREYGRKLATEKARTQWEAQIQAWLREWKQKTKGTTEAMKQVAGQEYREPKIVPGIYNVGGPYKYYAKGGPVTKRKPYIVGEEGPELFVPEKAGTIIPNPRTQERMRSLFVPRQYGGEVNSTGDEMSPILKRFLQRPGVAPLREEPIGTMPEQAFWYQNLLKQRRQQTPIRSLI